VNPVTGTGRTSVDISVNAYLELVDKFCYLGDMLSVDRDADAVVETRIRNGWNKFRQLVQLLTTHTHTHTQPFYGSVEFVRDNPGEPVPEETFLPIRIYH